MDEIIRRLRNRDQKSLRSLKESMPAQGLLEKDEEEELPPIEDEEVVDDAPEIDSTEDEEIDSEEEEPSPEESGSEESSEEDNEEGIPREEYINPLDNKFAVHYKIGHGVALTYANGTKTKITGVIDGYDKEGFYRVKWSNGKTMNGLTDIALSDMVEYTTEDKCVCGSTEFVTESKQLVCDVCGRVIRESNDPLSKADKSRPKGKRMIRSEAHPISTAISEDCSSKSTIQDSIRNAFKSKKLKEDVDDISFSKLEKALSGEFWTRKSEMVADIVAEGFDVPDYNDEYVVVSIGEDEEDEDYKEFLIPIGGTARTMTLDFDRAREL